MMSRKDYVRAARIVQAYCAAAFNDVYSHTDMDGLIDTFVRFFRDDNPRFDETRFRAACDPVKERRRHAANR